MISRIDQLKEALIGAQNIDEKKIAEKIKEAFRLRKEAKALLEEAKEKVEEVILN